MRQWHCQLYAITVLLYYCITVRDGAESLKGSQWNFAYLRHIKPDGQLHSRDEDIDGGGPSVVEKLTRLPGCLVPARTLRMDFESGTHRNRVLCLVHDR